MKYDALVLIGKSSEDVRRNELAKSAMHAMLSNMKDDMGVTTAKEDFIAISKLAYRMADMMIAEGKK